MSIATHKKCSTKKPTYGNNSDFKLHCARRKSIVSEFPEVKKLYGYDNSTQYYAYLCIISMIFLSHVCKNSWIMAISLGFLIGPYIDAGILALMHEATHLLIFAEPWQNRLLSIFTNMVMMAPISEIFKQHHSIHHMSLGTTSLDVDMPTQFEIKFVGNNSFLKFLFLALNMIILPTRSFFKLSTTLNCYLVLNWIVCIGFGIFAYFYSAQSFTFLLLSLLNSQGFHPANARQLQRHFDNCDETLEREEHEPYTYSYYGAWNSLFLNVGYHIEHHDFTCIPWTMLPELRRVAGEKWYPSHRAHKSRGMSDLINFVFNPKIDLTCFRG